MREGSRGPLKGVASAQKALQGSETETRDLLGGTLDNSVSRQGFIGFPSRQINDFFTYLAPLIIDYLQPPCLKQMFKTLGFESM